MGLDMYLSATRTFDPNSEEAAQILSAAGTTLDALKALTALDPLEHEQDVYLAMWGHQRPDEVAKSKAVLKAAGILDLFTEEAASGHLGFADDRIFVSVNCCYWRKANSIHAWFVDECQGGVDECQTTPVDAAHLALLVFKCQEAIALAQKGDIKAAGELLMPRSGFFFGSTDLDEYYLEDLEVTVEQVTKALTTAAQLPGKITFSYRSSW